MSTEQQRADLSLYGLREFFEDTVENKVNKEIASDGVNYKVLSDKNFSETHEFNLNNLHNSYITHSHVPIAKETGLILTSVANASECVWSDIRAEFDGKIELTKNNINEVISELQDIDEELRIEIYNRCTMEETKALVKNEVGQYLGNPELVETLKKLNIALKEQKGSETVGEYLLAEFENKYDKYKGEHLELCIQDLDRKVNEIIRVGQYQLQPATTEKLGGVKIGYGLKVEGDGLLYLDEECIVTAESVKEMIDKIECDIPIASKDVLGGIKVSPTGGLEVDPQGYLKIRELDIQSPEEWETKLEAKVSHSCIMVGEAEFSDKSSATEIETDGRIVRHVSITPLSLYYSKEGEVLPFSYYYTVQGNKVSIFSTIDYNVKDDAGVLFSYMILLEDQEH